MVATGHGKKSRGLADHHDVGVFVDDAYLLEQCLSATEERIFLHIESLHHVGKDRHTLMLAGRVEVSLDTHLATLRWPYPELFHAEGLEVVQVGVLQEFGSTTFARTSRRNTDLGMGLDGGASFFVVEVLFLGEGSLVVLKDVDEVSHVALCVVHSELTKSPRLEGLRLFFAEGFQGHLFFVIFTLLDALGQFHNALFLFTEVALL